MRSIIATTWMLLGLCAPSFAADAPDRWRELAAERDAYRRALASDKYPYLTWAAHHYACTKGGKLPDRDYPLTWEAEASQAKYEGMGRVSPEYVKKRLCAPHTWHAAEVFLYLLEAQQ